MQTEVKHTLEITLTLSAEEARWLNGVMQNPFYVDQANMEDDADQVMRSKFFEATKAARIT